MSKKSAIVIDRDNWQRDADRLRAVNAKLLKALEPFADIASQFEDLDDDFPVDCVDLGECRRARDAIEEAKK